MSRPGCIFGLIVTGLQMWLFTWATWGHPQFWFILGAMIALMVINGVISNAEKADV